MSAAADPPPGRVRWSTPRPPFGRWWGNDDWVVSVDRDGTVVWRDAFSGEVVWARPTAMRTIDSVAWGANVVLAMAGSLWMVEPGTGRTRARHRTEGTPTVAGAASGFAAGDRAGLRWFGPEGELRWGARVANLPPLGDDQRVPASPVRVAIAEGIVVVDSGLEVAAHRQHNGARGWARRGAALLGGGTETVLVTEGDRVVVVDAVGGGVRWEATVGPSPYAPYPTYHQVAEVPDGWWLLGTDDLLRVGAGGDALHVRYERPEVPLAWKRVYVTSGRVVVAHPDGFDVVDAVTGALRGSVSADIGLRPVAVAAGAAVVEQDRTAVAIELP